MARLRRLVVPGQLHLAVQRSQGGQAAFRDDADRRTYLEALTQSARDTGVAIHAFAVLPSEVRLLLTPADATGLGTLMQSVGRRYVRAFNLRHGLRGTPWEGRFRSTLIETPGCFVQALRFAEGLEAGSGGSAVTGPWSSAAHHAGQGSQALVAEHAAFWAFGNTPFEREARYRALVEVPMPAEDLARIRHAVINGWVLGSAEFALRIGAETGRRPAPLARGRPRKVSSEMGTR